MCSTVPLFRRVILQSGTPAGNPPAISIQDKEAQYLRLLEYCGIEKNEPCRLEKLRGIPIQKLVKSITDLNITSFGPWADPEFFPVAPYLSEHKQS